MARDIQRLLAVKEICRLHGSEVNVYPCNLENPHAYQGLIEKIGDHFGRIHSLINSAGIWDERPLFDYPQNVIDQMLLVNISAVIHLSRLVAPHIRKEHSGAIVTIGSVAGTRCYKQGSVYCATKHAVRAFSHALFLEERQYGTKVCIINPGVVDTPMHEDDPRYSKKQMLRPEDVVQAVKYVLEASESCTPVEIVLQPQYGS